jgi:hypothetical protein
MMTLVLWETNPSLFPLDPEERMKLIMGMAEGIKKDLESGAIKMWGISAGGARGFSITEREPKEIYVSTAKYFPHINFEVRPMLSIDEMIDTMKSMQP